MESCDIAVIGGGAAGLTAAIFAAETAGNARIVVLDGAASIGAKILISGGGRCNVTHDAVAPRDFNGAQPIIRNVLAAFDVAATRRWFGTLGVALKREETGKLFPTTDSARTVLDALLRRCEALRIDMELNHRVAGVDASTGSSAEARFAVEHQHGTLRAARVIVATGGRSLPRTGSDGTGWQLMRRLGHSVTETYPALVPLVLDTTMFHASLSGVSQIVELSTYAAGKRIDRRCGSMLWTHFGVSGPVVLDASRHWVIAHARGETPELRCNFLPGNDFAAADKWLQSNATQHARMSLGRCLAQRLPDRLASALAQWAGFEASLPLSQVSRLQRRTLAHALTAFSLPVTRDRGWNFAEVTAGGVPLDEIDYRTMQSRRAAGLYLVGEMLDCDGRIGGFNFQWAWSTGYIAGRSAGAEVRNG